MFRCAWWWGWNEGAGRVEQRGRNLEDQADGFSFAAIDAGHIGAFEHLDVGFASLRVELLANLRAVQAGLGHQQNTVK